MKTLAVSVLALLTGCCLGYYLTLQRRHSVKTCPLTIYDTVRQVSTDTIYIPAPSCTERRQSHAVTVPTRPTIMRCDSDSVTLLATTHVYSDSGFRAVVSGVYPSLDSIILYHPTCTVTRTVTCHTPVSQSAPRTVSRLGLGITAGVTATRSGLSPGVTVGITYRLWH